MAPETRTPPTGDTPQSALSRRDFVTMAIGAGLAAAADHPAWAAQGAVQVSTVDVTTPDGTCDAAFIHPGSGKHPAVLVWPDAFGLRPSMIDIGRRIAAEGYTVLVPNPYYRMTKAPGIDMAGFSFQNQADMAKLRPLMGSITAPGAGERDAVAFIAYLDAQPQVDTSRKVGTQGYCMGGPLVFKTAAAVPGRVGAGASFHGGGLVTDQPTSPHLLIPKMQARLYIGIAANDDERQPEAKDTLKAACADAKVPAEIEVYGSQHGWCVPDMPAGPNGPIYDRADAEKAWAKLVALYRTALA
ncbi:MAG: dienelactone hydrolase family protein [Vicinamibacterales bacterium]